MKIDVRFTLAEVDPAGLVDATAVVIDVIRATTSIVEALANGAGRIYPMASTEDAVRLAQSLGREESILCGERKGVKVEGFDLGNSPWEFTSERVAGKKLAMSTTNGTIALSVAGEAQRVLVGAFTNLGAVTREVSGDPSLVVLCAGREGVFAIDDALCAGHLVRRVIDAVEGDHELSDAASAALVLSGSLEPSRTFLQSTTSGRNLMDIGLSDDLDICAQLDRHDIVPVMNDHTITLAGS